MSERSGPMDDEATEPQAAPPDERAGCEPVSGEQRAGPERPGAGGAESGTHDRASEHAVQLRLLPGRSASRPDWILDERTRNRGRQGVAQAREILRQHRPPEPAPVRK